jgi:molecular chaperone DnaK (HSP70)
VQLLCDHVEDGALYPEEVSAYVVAELLSAAETHTDSKITKAVISVWNLSFCDFAGHAN